MKPTEEEGAGSVCRWIHEAYMWWSVDDPINFDVTRSKVKVTVAFNAKTMSAQYLETFMSDSHST